MSYQFTTNCRNAPAFRHGYIRRLMFTKAPLLYQPKCWRLQKHCFCASHTKAGVYKSKAFVPAEVVRQ